MTHPIPTVAELERIGWTPQQKHDAAQLDEMVLLLREIRDSLKPKPNGAKRQA